MRAVPENASTSTPRERRRREQQQVAEQVIEPIPSPVDEHDPPRAARDRGVERELEIGRVLLGRMPVDGGARRDRGLDRARLGGVEVADEMIARADRARSRRASPESAAITSAPSGSRSSNAGATGSTPGEHDCHGNGRSAVHGPSLRRHYPEQVRGVGGGPRHVRRRRGHPLSPARPSSPWV